MKIADSRHLEACLEVKREHPNFTYIEIAAAVNERLAKLAEEGQEPETISYMKVKRCFDVARLMEAEGLSEPYRVLTEKPEYASRWKKRQKKVDEVA